MAWHIVTIQSQDGLKTVEPVLAVAAGAHIVFVQVSPVAGESAPKCSFIQRTTLDFDIMNFKVGGLILEWKNYLPQVFLSIAGKMGRSIFKSVD